MVNIFNSRTGYCESVGSINPDGAVFDRNGYFVGQVGNGTKRELEEAKEKERNGGRQNKVPWTDNNLKPF